mmetsp:Transcript_34074/g.101849  ORF Transcript_34074/g.101849 Transcript_34074/m.101849 type:complete len:231 (+) Transcript_34074:835-1527(+)
MSSRQALLCYTSRWLCSFAQGPFFPCPSLPAKKFDPQPRSVHSSSFSSTFPIMVISSAYSTHLDNSPRRSSISNDPRSPSFLLLTARVPDSISFIPTTAMMGTRCCSAFRICFPNRSFPRSTSTRRPNLAAFFDTSSQYSLTPSVTGRSRICAGASHRGKSPAQFSTSMPKNRSTLPKMARWIMMGRSRVPSAETYSISKRSGRLKSHCTVEHCHVRPMASRILRSILGP